MTTPGDGRAREKKRAAKRKSPAGPPRRPNPCHNRPPRDPRQARHTPRRCAPPSTGPVVPSPAFVVSVVLWADPGGQSPPPPPPSTTTTTIYYYSPKCPQPAKFPKLVNKIAGEGAGPYGRCKNPSLETRAKEHFSTGELNAKMRSKKVFDFVFFSSVVSGNLFWIAFWSLTHLWKNVLWLAFQVEDFYSARKEPHPRPQFY